MGVYSVYARAMLGFLLGWLTHPALWLLGGPFRWAALLWGTWSQESGLNPDQFNPERLGSGGLGQFQADTWNLIMPSRWATATYGAWPSDDPRRSPWLQGLAAALYVNAAVGSDLRWLWIGAPVYGFPWVRVLWRNGIHGLSALPTWREVTDLGSEYVRTEGKAGPAFQKARMVTLIPAALVGYLLYRRAERRGL